MASGTDASGTGGSQKPAQRGSLKEALRNRPLVIAFLIGVILVCGAILALKDLGKPWLVTFQAVSAVAGAALGNFLRHDFGDSVVRNQARPAIRHLFDHVMRLRSLIERAELCEAHVREKSAAGDLVDQERIGDWFGTLGSGLRDEIMATATAIENWSDLVPEIQGTELQNYQTRDERLPATGESARTS